MDDRILERPVWSALTTIHAEFAVGSHGARRFLDDISPFGASQDESGRCLSDLADLVPSGGHIIIAQTDPIICPQNARTSDPLPAVQMLFDGALPRSDDGYPVEILTAADAPAMMALATMTNPGPFAPRTHLLGEYWGVKDRGRLVAMAGERLKQPGFTEISGVCTHPEYQKRGLAGTLCRFLTTRITNRGETPYLHAFESNTGAIKLYEAMGFRIRRPILVARLERAS